MVGKRPVRGRLEKRWTLAGAAGALLFAFAGCGESGGIARYDLSGEVRFDGQAVPQGYLQFVPDRKQGNLGPGTSATIKEGRFQTVGSLGIIGGPHVVKITGTDGIPYKTADGLKVPIGRPLFPEYTVRVDFPKQAGTHDFDVPALPTGKK